MAGEKHEVEYAVLHCERTSTTLQGGAHHRNLHKATANEIVGSMKT